MPNAIETRLAQLEALVNPGAKQRAATVQQTAAERAALVADLAAVTSRRERHEAAHPVAVKEFRAAIVAAIAARSKLATIETSIEDALRDQRNVAGRLGVEVPTFIPRVTTQDFSYLLVGIDEQIREISRRANA